MPAGRRVLIIPGFATSDRSTIAIRASLSASGHRPHRWRLGRNEGPSEHTMAGLDDRLSQLVEREQGPVALVGWSLGGVYAHWLARRSPERVLSVVTLGSPLRARGDRPPALSVPTTSIYSRLDRIVPWRASLIDDRADRHENIEVRTGHFGLGFDPAVLYAVNHRLRQHPERWRPFRPPAPMGLAFPDPNRSAA